MRRTSVVLLAVLLAGCASAEKQWREAVQTDGPWVYPEGPLAGSAPFRVADVLLERAREVNSIEGWTYLQDRFPEGEVADEAADALEDIRDRVSELEAVTLGGETRVTAELAGGGIVNRIAITRPLLIASLHLLEGYETDETDPYVRGDYSSHEKLTRLVHLRLYQLLKSLGTEDRIPTAREIWVRVYHGVRVSSLIAGAPPPRDTAKNIYSIAITPKQVLAIDWTSASVEEVVEFWRIMSNDIRFLSFGPGGRVP